MADKADVPITCTVCNEPRFTLIECTRCGAPGYKASCNHEPKDNPTLRELERFYESSPPWWGGQEGWYCRNCGSPPR